MSAVQVGILMGSQSDDEIMSAARKTLEEFGVGCVYKVASAHRCPEVVAEFAKNAKANGFKVIIAGAGGAAHLPGVIAAFTPLPVIGVPIPTSLAGGLDSLLSIVQMPKGVPVASVAANKAGARNAALLAVEILALSDEKLAGKLDQFRERQAAESHIEL